MDWAEAARYLAAESPATERANFEAWLAADPARAELLDSLRPVMALRHSPAPEVDIELAWRKLSALTREPMLVATPAPSRWFRFPELSLASAIAAALLVVAGAGTWMLTRPTEAPDVMRQFATRAGERKNLTLDGRTRVSLAPATTMIVTTRNGSVRSVRLSGEGYFSVIHRDNQPFSVYTREVVIRDLGTRFSVRALPDSPRTEVIVAEGAVQMRSAASGDRTSGVVVRAGETASSDNAQVSHVSAAVLQRSLGWTRGELSFVDAPLTAVAADLERWYGVPIRVEGLDLRSRTLTATFAGETLDQALAAIVRTLGVRYERDAPAGAVVIRAR